MEKSFNVNFDGYIRFENIHYLPTYSGVYGVYTCIHDPIEKTVFLKKLIYIGKADNINSRINNHEKTKDWETELQRGEELCFNYAEIDKTYNERVEAALIFSNKPKLNVEYIDSFPFDKTHLNVQGKNKFMKVKVTVERT